MTAILELKTTKKGWLSRFPSFKKQKPRIYGDGVAAYRMELAGDRPSARQMRRIHAIAPDFVALDEASPLPPALETFPVCRGTGLTAPLVLRRLMRKNRLDGASVALLGASAPFASFWARALLECGVDLALWDWRHGESEALAANLLHRYGCAVQVLFRPILASQWDVAVLLAADCPYAGDNELTAHRPRPLSFQGREWISPAVTESLLSAKGFHLPAPDGEGEVMPRCQAVWQGLDQWKIAESENAFVKDIGKDVRISPDHP